MMSDAFQSINTTFQNLTPEHWILIVIACLITMISHTLLTLAFTWVNNIDKRFKLIDEDGVYLPNPFIDVVTNDTDETLGQCSLMTMTYLFATGHDISLYGCITVPFKKDYPQTIYFNGPVTLREWIIALHNMHCPASIELLEYLDEIGINTDVTPIHTYNATDELSPPINPYESPTHPRDSYLRKTSN